MSRCEEVPQLYQASISLNLTCREKKQIEEPEFYAIITSSSMTKVFLSFTGVLQNMWETS